MMQEKIDILMNDVRQKLMSRRITDGMWRGELSSSAISTSVSVFALYTIDKEKYCEEIEKGVKWLTHTMQQDGSWGDSVESPSNMTATLLSYTSLYAIGKAPEESRKFLEQKFGITEADKQDQDKLDKKISDGVLDYYGTDLTFSVPILSMCALSGVISSWKRIPPFPFELAVLPQKFFRFLNLPVVSYAIPALIAIGILQLRKKHKLNSITAKMREPFVRSTMKKLITLQPEDGGFLEAAPLTAFVSMCLSAAGFTNHPVTQKSAKFLVDTQRKDGSWPIDTDLAGWATSLAATALGDDLDEKQKNEIANIIKNNATKDVHQFTGAPAGGWGWTNLTGSVPDGDDTSGALVALHKLLGGKYCEEVGKGIEWLMQLQNNDGGMPTFCKGWGKLPFDRSAPDITAHAILAMGLWVKVLPAEIKSRCEKCLERMMAWLEKNSVSAEGSSCIKWTPLWFGDQDATDEKSHVYGTATLMDYLTRLDNQRATTLACSGLDYLLETQNPDGGWGGQKDVRSKVTLTAKAIGALCGIIKQQNDEKSNQQNYKITEAIVKGIDFLYERYEEGTLYEREPIGLYFARLWYSEELYNMCYILTALNKRSLTI